MRYAHRVQIFNAINQLLVAAIDFFHKHAARANIPMTVILPLRITSYKSPPGHWRRSQQTTSTTDSIRIP
jgi:hypothetical protein